MALQCGIVGLPNVGKSTLFNALTAAGAEASNYAFCTIEPNIGVVAVPDPRLDRIAELIRPTKVTPTTMRFVDIAGLVKGASRGEGLGNQFLAHVREVDAIIHCVRCFDDDDVTHVAGRVDPVDDISTINIELCLADLKTVENHLERNRKMARVGDKEVLGRVALMQQARDLLDKSRPLRMGGWSASDCAQLKTLHLLTLKPMLYLCNVREDQLHAPPQYVADVEAFAQSENAGSVTVSAKVEAEIAELDDAERQEYLQDLGLEIAGLDRVIQTGYGLLGLITFFTAGPQECRAWTVRQGARAPQAAGTIHTDFERGFIRAEVYDCNDLFAHGTEAAVRAKGLMRLEGKEYEVHDGDVMHFRFNV